MLRDLNISVNGRRDSSDPRVGVLASEIPAGFSRESFLLNDIDAAVEGRLYSLEILTQPASGVLSLDKRGVGTYEGGTAGTFKGTQRVRKFDPGIGQVSSVDGEYTLQVLALPSTVTGVTVTPAAATGAQQFQADVIGQNSPLQAVTWSTTAGTISDTGAFVPPEPTTSVQTITVRARSVQDRAFSGTAIVTIAALPVPAVTVTDVVISPSSAVLRAGTTMQFSAEVIGTNNPSQEVTWSTDLGTVDKNGLLVPPEATSMMQLGKLTATSLDDPRVSDSVDISVLPLSADFVPSVARTVRILPGRLAFAVGSHWTLGTAGPVGAKDPNSIIDVTFDWSAWLADIGAARLSKVEFLLGGGLQMEDLVPGLTGGTVLVSGGTLNTSTTITCRITTATAPVRTDDRTVVLQIKDQ